MDICDKKTVIEVSKNSDDTYKLNISNCEHIQKYAQKLGNIDLMDACKPICENPMYLTADCLTPTCLVPSATVSIIWIDAGMMSKDLTVKNKNEVKYSE